MNWPIPSPEPVVFEVTPITVVVEETAYFSGPENAGCAHVVFALPLLFLTAMTLSARALPRPPRPWRRGS